MTARKHSNRRDFIKHIGGLAAMGVGFPQIIPSTVLGSTAAGAPSNRVCLASIGVGGQGGGLMGAFLWQPNVRFVATCDPFKSRREKAAKRANDYYAEKYKTEKPGICKPYNDFREVLSRDDIDGVIIATPDHWHVPIGIAAARAGKDTYIEKPLGLTMEQNKAMRKAVHRYGTVFQYGTQQRGTRNCAYACELVRNGRIGEIKEIHVVAPAGAKGGNPTPQPVPEGFDYNLWLGPAPKAPYTHDRCIGTGRWYIYDYAIGFLGGWGAHPLDLAHWGYPQIPVEYEGTGTIPTEGLFNTVTNWDIRGQYANGIKYTFKDGPDMTTFVGTEGWVAVSRGSIKASDKNMLKSVIKPDEIHLYQNENNYVNFVSSMKSRKKPHSDIDSAAQSDFMSHLSDIAIRTGRKIKWDPKTEQITGDPTAAGMMTRPMRSPWHL